MTDAQTNGNDSSSTPVSDASVPERARDAQGRFAQAPETDFSTDEKALATLEKIWDREGQVEAARERVGDVQRNGQPKPKPAPKVVEEIEAEEPEIEVAADADPEPDDTDPEEVASGIQALKRLKMPESALSALSRAELAEYGKVAAAQTAERDNLNREIGELKKRLKETGSKSAESAKAESPALDFKKLVRPFAEQLDEETGKALEKVFGDYHSHQETRIAQLERALGVVSHVSEERLLKDSRIELTEEFPSLADPKVFARVRERMAKQQQGDEYGLDFTTLMRHSLLIEGIAKAAKPSPQPISRDPKRKGLPIATAARSTPKAQTREDRDAAVFNAAEMRNILDVDQLKAITRGS